MSAVNVVIHLLVAATLPPLLLGVINKVKAAFGGRVGPPWLQAYYDIFKLLRKGSVFSTTTGWLFRFGPVAALATAALAALLLPLGSADAPLSFDGDFILFAYLLGLGRFFTMLAALDTGSSFEGMGAAREASFACLAEPVLFFGLLVLAKVTGSLSLAGLLGPSLSWRWGLAGASLLLVLVSWLVVLLAENSRIPFDDPNTHLELTMIHEVMVLDHGGPALGVILYAAALKLFLFAALVVRLAVPLNTGLLLADWGLFVVAVLGVAAVVGVVESVMARLRMPAVPNLLIGAGALAAFGWVLLGNQ